MPSVRTETCQEGGPLGCCVVVGSSEATGFPMMGIFESSVEANLSVADFSRKLDGMYHNFLNMQTNVSTENRTTSPLSRLGFKCQEI
jgi:hypothetical protein